MITPFIIHDPDGRFVSAVTPAGECNRDLSTTRLADRANPQSTHVVVESLYAHCPRKPKKPTSMNDRPSMRLNEAGWPRNNAERILFGLASDKGAEGTSSPLPKNTVENKYRYPILRQVGLFGLSIVGQLIQELIRERFPGVTQTEGHSEQSCRAGRADPLTCYTRLP